MQTKYIVIDDIGKDLNPIGYGLKSPINTPSKFSIDIIGRLLNESNVTKMTEAYPQDRSLRVPLDRSNYTKPFIEIWKEVNPGKKFPLDPVPAQKHYPYENDVSDKYRSSHNAALPAVMTSSRYNTHLSKEENDTVIEESAAKLVNDTGNNVDPPEVKAGSETEGESLNITGNVVISGNVDDLSKTKIGSESKVINNSEFSESFVPDASSVNVYDVDKGNGSDSTVVSSVESTNTPESSGDSESGDVGNDEPKKENSSTEDNDFDSEDTNDIKVTNTEEKEESKSPEVSKYMINKKRNKNRK